MYEGLHVPEGEERNLGVVVIATFGEQFHDISVAKGSKIWSFVAS